MKTILVATDFSPKARLASEVAISLVHQFKSDIHFLNVFHTPVNWSKLPKEQEGRFKEVKAKIGAAKAMLTELETEAKQKGLNASSVLSYDHENMNVLQHIRSHRHDLVVIGAHSRLTISDVLFGSVAINIIKNSPVSVLMVDEVDKFTSVKSILVAVDPDSNVAGFIKKVSDLFPAPDVKIKAFSVRIGTEKENGKILAGLNELIRRQTAENVTYGTVSAPSVEEGIIEKANGSEGDLLVIGPNRFSRVTDYLRTHVFPSVSSRVQKPLLILK
tara:strand:+ start:352 stop:1173 length:822 start_codon:yes stop_codon:yes gene_type:complete